MPPVLLGVKFLPTDEELISYFLKIKNNVSITAKVPPTAIYNYNKIIRERDLYGDEEPWQIWKRFGGSEQLDQDMYFFTKPKMVNPDGTRINRKVGSGGTWSEGEPGKDIESEITSQKIGQKRKFRYENKGSDQNGSWYLEEYNLDPMNSEYYVLCRLRQNIKAGKERKDIPLYFEESIALSMTHIPVGFRFHPTDQELISYFLRKKVTEASTLDRHRGIVRDFDLFGSTEPWKIWKMYGGHELFNQDLYFFTELKKASPNGKRFLRKIGSSGTWSETDASKLIKDEQGQKDIGRRRKLRYESKSSKHHGHWYLDEYSLLDSELDYVICRLRKNDKSSEWNVNKRKYSAWQQLKELKLLTGTNENPRRKQSNAMMNMTNIKNNLPDQPLAPAVTSDCCKKFKLFGVEIRL